MKTQTETFTPQHIKRWNHPSNYAGATWENYYSSGFGQSRDSSELEESNFAFVLRNLQNLPTWENATDDEDAVSRYVVRESHWAVGWVEWIAIHETDIAALEFCDKCKADAENYVALDEDDWGQREDESAQRVWKDCYNTTERLAYVRDHRSQFEFDSFADMLGCIRGKYFCGYASELLH